MHILGARDACGTPDKLPWSVVLKITVVDDGKSRLWDFEQILSIWKSRKAFVLLVAWK